MELHVTNLQAFSRALDRAAMHPRRPGRPMVSALILSALAQQRRIWSMQELIERLYGDDPNGGPLDARGSIKVAIHHLRRAGHDIRRELYRGYYLEAEPT
ncbi:helix-turn-helix domain-containing protein [Ferrovibrio sp.]|uniref:helix-turn-helix domain-containing protein n=1 Tax=Ferrovibrio sp. TaxID=1917215 RepID=UPI0035B2C4C3